MPVERGRQSRNGERSRAKRVVLDTSAFYHERALRRLPRSLRVVVPALAFTERARQLKRDRRASPGEFRQTLLDRGWEIEAFREVHALRAAHLAPTHDARWIMLARDVVIAAHVGVDDVLLTANVADFLELGLDAARLRDPTRAV